MPKAQYQKRMNRGGRSTGGGGGSTSVSGGGTIPETVSAQTGNTIDTAGRHTHAVLASSNPGNHEVLLKTDADGQLHLLGAELGRVHISDLVGIGTSAPGAMLDVRGDVIINENGGNYDVRIEGETNPNLVFVDASANRVGIKTNSPDTDLDVHGDVTARRLYLSENDTAGGTGNVYFGERPGTTNRALMVYGPGQNTLFKAIISPADVAKHWDVGITAWSRDRDGAGTPDVWYFDILVKGWGNSGDCFLASRATAGLTAGDVVLAPNNVERLRVRRVDGALRYPGNLVAYRNATEHQGYIYIPLATPLTSTAWDGDAYSTTATTKIDTSAVFGAPAGIKAAMVRLIARDSGAHPQTSLHVTLSTGSDMLTTAQMSVRQPGADVMVENCGIVTCDANGDFYYTVNASGAGTTDVWLSIVGYFI